MTDPITSALNNAVGLINGTNPPFAPQITELIGTNIPGQPLISARDYFLAQMDSWITATPLSTQWIVLIERLPFNLTTEVLQTLERTDGSKHGFDIDNAKNTTYNHATQKIVGCLFTYGATLPGEQYDVGSVSIPNNRGFAPGIIAQGRQIEAPTLALEFRDTNTSFVDFVIRPWVILASHYGLAARPGDTSLTRDPKNVKANVMVMQYSRSLANMSMIPRKVWQFYNCVPYNVSEQSLDYTEEKLTTISTRWTYSHYTVANNSYFPIISIINNISKNGFPTITGGAFNINSFQPL